MAKRILAMQESDLRMSGDLAMNIQRVLPVTQADIDAAAAVGQGWVVEQVFEVSLPIDNTVGQTWRVIKVNSITPGQNVKRVMIVPNPHQKTIVVSGIPPLQLLGAVEDSLSELKAFGGTKLSAIPLEYTQVDYAIKKGTAGVQGKFDTGIKPTVDDVKIEMKIKIGDEAQASGQTTVGSFYACQSRAAANSDITGISGSSASGSINGMQSGQSVASGIVRVKDHIDLISYEYKNGTHSIYVKDLTTNTEDTQTGTYTFSAPTKNLYIFGNTTTTNNLNNNNALYYCKIWVSGSLAFDAVPVIRNSDNIVGLYDKVSESFIEPIVTEGGGFVAGDVTTPTPSDPMDIYCNNGKISVLDHTNWNVITNPTSQTGQGMFISSDGKLQKANDRGAGVFIPVTVGKKYTLLINKKTTALGTIIRYGQSNNGDLPNSAEQLLDWYRGAIEDMMIISFTAKRPYFVMQLAASLVEAGGIDEAVEVIEAAGDNETIAIDGTRYIDPSDCVIGKYIDNSGAIATNAANYYCNTYFAVEPNTTYTMKTESDVWSFNVAEYDSGKTFIQRTLDPTPHGNKTEFSITTSATTRFIRVGNNTSPDGGTSNPTTLAIIQSLKPRIDGIHCSATANNLFAVSTYKDVQEIITGATTHKCGIRVFDGTENFETATATNCYSLTNTLGTGNFADRTIVCSHFASTPTMPGTNDRQGLAFIVNKGQEYTIAFGATTQFSTLALWQQFLADQYANGTPVIVVYPLATEYAEVAPIAQAMNVVDGDNTLSLTQQGMTPLEVSATYTAGVSVTITEIENANIGNDVDVVIA